jgi:hypothetical protein
MEKKIKGKKLIQRVEATLTMLRATFPCESDGLPSVEVCKLLAALASLKVAAEGEV